MEWGHPSPHAFAHAELQAHQSMLHVVRLVARLRLPERAAADLERLLADPGEDPQRPLRPHQLPGPLPAGSLLRVALRLLRHGPDPARLAHQWLARGAAPPRHALRPERRPAVHLLQLRVLARVRGLRALRLPRADQAERPPRARPPPAPGGHLRGRGPAGRGLLQQRRRHRRGIARWRPRPLDEAPRQPAGRHRRAGLALVGVRRRHAQHAVDGGRDDGPPQAHAAIDPAGLEALGEAGAAAWRVVSAGPLEDTFDDAGLSHGRFPRRQTAA
mmetsp:Transcript_104508/g.312072  ORF Transcript_104508/g.312072 Transcript_104508/m.312072 type:complete len:273 (+) Transcript_104508:702-1520(+)